VEWKAHTIAAFHPLKRVEAGTGLSSEAAADLWEDQDRIFT